MPIFHFYIAFLCSSEYFWCSFWPLFGLHLTYILHPFQPKCMHNSKRLANVTSKASFRYSWSWPTLLSLIDDDASPHPEKPQNCWLYMLDGQVFIFNLLCVKIVILQGGVTTSENQHIVKMSGSKMCTQGFGGYQWQVFLDLTFFEKILSIFMYKVFENFWNKFYAIF